MRFLLKTWIPGEAPEKEELKQQLDEARKKLYDLAYGCGCDLWYDHTDHFCFFGTECLCLDGRAIACLLYNFADRLFLLF